MFLFTKSGKHVIFDITDPTFLPGRIPQYFLRESTEDRFWFFQPAEWFPLTSDYGSFAAELSKFPVVYSTGFKTPEDALEAAEAWELRDDLKAAGGPIAWATVHL